MVTFLKDKSAWELRMAPFGNRVFEEGMKVVR
jgi:hypothetical protein